MNKRIFPLHLVVLIIFIAVINMFANTFSLYWRIEWLDMFMHFLGGIWVGLTALWFFSRIDYFNMKGFETNSKHIFLVSIFSVLLVGLMWELFEFGVSTLITFSQQNNLIDTISDLVFDLLGAIVSAVYFIRTRE